MNNNTYKKISRSIDKQKDSQKMKKADRLYPQSDYGLTATQVESRQNDHLTNHRNTQESKSYLRIVTDNLFNFCNIVCIALVILLCSIGAWDYTLSTSIILVNIVIGIWQEVKAKKAVSKLAIVHKAGVKVVRDGKEGEIDSSDIVLDDVIVLGAGAQAPVDCVLLDGYMEVDESILTGESVPIRKNIGDNILAGSHIVAGEARCRADRVGKDCYIEKILRIASKFNKPKSMIFNTLNFIIKCLSCVLVVLGVFIFLSERLTMTGQWRDLIITVASSILGMLPVGMFMLTSTALAGSVLKLSKTGALPQDIYAIEMLAQVDTLLLDKTGTLTDGQMKVVDVKILDPQVDVRSIMASINYWTRDNKPTARALVDYFGGSFDNASQDSGEVKERFSLVMDCDEVRSFSSLRKCSAIKIGENCYFLGAPDYVAVPSEETERYCHDNACVGKRTIMLSTAKGDIDKLDKNNAAPIALFALEDRLRENVKDTLDWFARNDVDIKIISGDNPETVSYIASKAGVREADKYLNCSVVKSMSSDVVEDTVVFGRVSPSQKEEIVKALQDKGRVVGMIGDGVNDIQALKESDCSISFLGAHEVARNISRIVLLNNDFGAMPNIVREGRRVINNMEKVSSLYIMKTIFIMVMTFVFSIITLATHTPSYPFDTKKIMIVEMFVIGLPTYIYAFQPNDARISGRFMHNIIKSSISATVGLCVAVFVTYALNFRIDFGGVENLENYRNSILTIALIVSSFGAMLIISSPLNKLRACVIATMIILTVASVYIDSHYLGNLFFGLEVVAWRHLPYAILGGLIGTGSHLALYWIVEAMDKKWGDEINEKAKRIARAIKNKMKRIRNDAHQS